MDESVVIRVGLDRSGRRLRWSLEVGSRRVVAASDPADVLARAAESVREAVIPILVGPDVAARPQMHDRLLQVVADQSNLFGSRHGSVVYELDNVRVSGRPASPRIRLASLGDIAGDHLGVVSEGLEVNGLLPAIEVLRCSLDEPRVTAGSDLLFVHAHDLGALERVGAEPVLSRFAVVIGGSGDDRPWERARVGEAILNLPETSSPAALRQIVDELGHGSRPLDIADRLPSARLALTRAVVDARPISEPWSVALDQLQAEPMPTSESIRIENAQRLVAGDSSAVVDLTSLAHLNSLAPTLTPTTPPPGRRVDVVLRDSAKQVVPRDRTCVPGRYVLEVGVGRLPTGDLVSPDTQPLDDALPETEHGHWLEITVLGRNLRLLGPSTRRLRLPRSGPAGPATFALRFSETGPAWARILISYRQNVVQTYRFSTTVSGEPLEFPWDPTRAVLEHSEARNLRLETVTPRALSLVLNETAGTHQVYVKADGLAGMADIDPSSQKLLVTAVRELLERTAFDRLGDQKYRDDTIRDLADLGHQLYTAVVPSALPGEQESIPKIVKGHDLGLKIIRLNPQHALPWAVAYDWPVPQSIPEAKVCYDADGGCGHDAATVADRDVICCRGFWGIRHRIEEVLRLRADSDEPPTLPRPDDRRFCLLGLGRDDQDSIAIQHDLEQWLPGDVERVPADRRILDEIWSPATRPSLMAVVGDSTPDTSQRWVDGPRSRIATGTSEGHLTIESLVSRRSLAGGLDHRPMAMLLSCGSAADASPQSLSSFAKELTNARFAGVIGTEISVYPDDVRQFLEAFLSAFLPRDAAAWAGSGPPRRETRTLAVAMLAVRRHFIRKGTPYGFVFTALAPGDLAVEM